MKRAVLALAVLMLISCGSNPKTINGTWQAALANTDGSVAYTFLTSLTQGTGSAVSVSNFGFNSPASCFTSSLGETAVFSVSGNSNGYQTGSFQMTITTAFPEGVNNVLTLNGTRNSDGGISGNWTVTGLTRCPGNGTFTMHVLIPVDPPAH